MRVNAAAAVSVRKAGALGANPQPVARADPGE